MTDASSASGPVTVVLVHGAFADGSGWSGVIERLQAASVPVRAIVNPLRGITFDSAYVASVFSHGPAAWKNLPCWAVVATGDKAAGADVVRSMAQRAKAQIAEVDGSHVIMISQPQAVTDTIMKALETVA